MGILLTELFSEVVAPLAKLLNLSFSSPINTGWIKVSDYGRLAVYAHVPTVGTTFDLAIWAATDKNGAGAIVLKHITQIAPGGATLPVVIEVAGNELGHPTGATGAHYDYVEVIATPAGTCALILDLFGLTPRQAAVDQTLYHEVIP